MKEEYCLFGLQRSGTNFVDKVFAMNFDMKNCNISERIWKHSIVLPKNYDETRINVVIHKNPYTWMESICFRSKVDWLRTQTKYPADQELQDEYDYNNYMIGPYRLNLINLSKTYKDFYEFWLNRDEVYVLRYEDILMDRDAVFEAFAGKYGLTYKTLIYPKLGTVPISRKYDSDMEQYYKEMRPKYLTQPQINKINEILTPGLFAIMGYNMI